MPNIIPPPTRVPTVNFDVTEPNLNYISELSFAIMFDGSDLPKPLAEDVFDLWLENGRLSKIGYKYLVIVWDEYELAYRPVYAAHRDEIETYKTSVTRERFIAAFDLYSEGRIG